MGFSPYEKTNLIKHEGAVTPPFKVQVSRNAKQEYQFEVSAHCETMADAMFKVTDCIASLEKLYPRSKE